MNINLEGLNRAAEYELAIERKDKRMEMVNKAFIDLLTILDKNADIKAMELVKEIHGKIKIAETLEEIDNIIRAGYGTKINEIRQNLDSESKIVLDNYLNTFTLLSV